MLRDLHGEEFLRAYHAASPGGTSPTLRHGRLKSGGSSYELLVGDAAREGERSRILDLCCGEGFLSSCLTDAYPDCEIVGLDLSEEELALARARLGDRVRFVRGEAGKIPLAGASVDTVLCHMAFMLIDDAARVVDEIARVLVPGGTFAAILGPAPGSSDLMRKLGGALHEAEAREGLERLRVGDERTHSAEGLRELFDGPRFSELYVENVVLVLDGSPEHVLRCLLSIYDVARLSDGEQSALRGVLETEMAAFARPDGIVPLTLGLRHIVVTTAGTMPPY